MKETINCTKILQGLIYTVILQQTPNLTYLLILEQFLQIIKIYKYIYINILYCSIHFKSLNHYIALIQ